MMAEEAQQAGAVGDFIGRGADYDRPQQDAEPPAHVMGLYSKINDLQHGAEALEEKVRRIADSAWGGIPRETATTAEGRGAKANGLFGALNQLESTLVRIHKELQRF